MKIVLLIILYLSIGFGGFIIDSIICAKRDDKPFQLCCWMCLWPILIPTIIICTLGDGIETLGNKIFNRVKDDVK